jgi:ectoine hydroxylase-related dioxygenase (phytanoyl-CoA dioxygenase family)
VNIALSDLTVANGCLRFMRGSHLAPTLPHREETDPNREKYVFPVSIPDEEVDESDGLVHAEMKLGQFCIHHGSTAHSSRPNQTDGERSSLAIRYGTYDVMFDSVAWPTQRILPMRGKNRFGTKYRIASPPTEFGISQLGDMPHLLHGMSKVQKLTMRLRRKIRKVLS